MSETKRKISRLFKGLLALAVASSPAVFGQDENEEIHELSPFSVDASDSEGYQALSTLAGSRLKTPLRDVGAAISVITAEFMEDTGATDAGTLLAYGLNTEVSGEQGNSALPALGGSGGIDAGDPSLDSNRAVPQTNGQRVRGLAAASLTRGFFLTDIPFDSYNTSRVTINRGPNSLLFGVGSPGGIINNSIKQATLGKTFGEVGIRFGENGSSRQTLDYNKVLIEDRLAVRFSAMNEELEFDQKPAYENDQRFYAAAEWVVSKNEHSDFFGRTILRGNYEDGSIEGTPVNVIPPRDGYGGWFAPQVDRSIEAITGVTLPGYIDNSSDERGLFSPKTIINTLPGQRGGFNGFPNQHSAWALQPIVYNDVNSSESSVGFPGRPEVDGTLGLTNWQLTDARAQRGQFATLATTTIYRAPWTPGFTQPVIMDTNVLDNRNLLLEGTTEFASHDWDVFNAALEQSLFNGKGGFELVYDKQDYNRFENFPWDEDVRIDVSSHLVNDQPNPNVGRAFFYGFAVDPLDRARTRESLRATAFYELDFAEREGFWGKLGSHTFTGLWNEQTIDNLGENHRLIWEDVDAPLTVEDIFSDPTGGGRNRPVLWAYVTDSLEGSEYQSASDVRFTQSISAVIPKVGDTYTLSWLDHPRPSLNPAGVPAGSTLATYVPGTGDPSFYNDFRIRSLFTGGSRSEQVITSEALAWQSKFWNGNIVGLIGWRSDQTVNTGQANVGGKLPSGDADPAQLMLAAESDDPLPKGGTRTNSLVVHVPDDLIDLGRTNVSFHWNESENFSPAARRIDIRGNNVPPPTGTTEEYGIGFEFNDGAVSLRISKFEMVSDFADAGLNGAANGVFSNIGARRWGIVESDGAPFEETIANATDTRFPDAPPAGTFNSYADVQSAIRSYLPRETEALINARFEPALPAPDAAFITDPIVGLTTTRSYISEGYEAELVGNPMKNWRLSLNVGQQETVTSKTAPVLAEVAVEAREGMMREGIWGLQIDPGNNSNPTFGSELNSKTFTPLARAQTKDGTVSLEQREWRVNIVNTYSFKEGAMKGFGLGGAWRYQSKTAAGYAAQVNEDDLVLPNLDRPFYGPAETNIDLWASYSRKLTDRIGWKIQLNVRNAIGDDDYIPVVINPDGRTAVVRNPNPKAVSLTNTLRF
ncbi:MAG: TonB-dependent receptor plug domain-containing protein [Opitutales bacterium]|nr:TonB-dependent receptor plug domain-containing protein [Opitutales bacterium]